ncbi:hypothetical protein K438DRAFT_2015133 [Mycena galopus ATCC 62051]|nr:hypothetical protein K438DRAFT_2015133 [Mycena galopus ATCC 62051]
MVPNNSPLHAKLIAVDSDEKKVSSGCHSTLSRAAQTAQSRTRAACAHRAREKSDFSLLSIAVLLVYSYGLALPVVLWVVLRYLVGPWSGVCLALYTNVPLHPTHSPWSLVCLIFAFSGYFRIRNVLPVLASAEALASSSSSRSSMRASRSRTRFFSYLILVPERASPDPAVAVLNIGMSLYRNVLLHGFKPRFPITLGLLMASVILIMGYVLILLKGAASARDPQFGGHAFEDLYV